MTTHDAHLANLAEADLHQRKLRQVEDADREIEAIVERLKDCALNGQALTVPLMDLASALHSWARATEGLM